MVAAVTAKQIDASRVFRILFDTWPDTNQPWRASPAPRLSAGSPACAHCSCERRKPTLRDLREALTAACGTNYGAHSPTWISRFNGTTRQAASYRKERVLLAGDSAHSHAPNGGQDLNLGVQDAVGVGWKLAQVVRGTSPETLLDTDHAERHPIAARV